MRAIVAEEAGGPEVLQLRQVDAPMPGTGELLVEVAAAGVNFIDTYRRSGLYPVDFPHTPGSEAAGTVSAVGEGVTEFAAGDRVAFAEGRRTYAEQAVVPADRAARVPERVSLETAAAIPLQGITAHYLVRSTFPLTEGAVAVIHAGAGGVGLLATQLAKRAGATVYTTVSSPAKEALSRAAGADDVFSYDDFAEHVRAATGGRGADVVYDGVGASTFDGSMAALRKRGVLVLFGGASGPVPPVDPQRLNAAGSLFLTRPTMGDFLLDAEERRWRYAELFAAIEGGLDVRVGASYDLADAGRAHEDLEGRRTTGKVLLTP